MKINTDLAADPNNPQKNDQQPNQQQATNVPAQQVVPIAQAVPVQQQTTVANPQVPPLFLQQEQAKQNKTASGLLESSVPLGLPVIPLPN